MIHPSGNNIFIRGLKFKFIPLGFEVVSKLVIVAGWMSQPLIDSEYYYTVYVAVASNRREVPLVGTTYLLVLCK